MKLRTIVLGVVACGLALCARRLTADSEPERLPVAAPVRDARVLAEVARMVRVDRAERVIEPLPVAEIRDDPEDPDGAVTVEERRAEKLVDLVDALDDKHGCVQGQIRDQATGEALAGVTIIVTSPALEQAQAAISDENGYYEITDLPRGEYLVTFYYDETTVERRGIVVGGGTLVPVFESLASIDENEDEVGISFVGRTTLENHYIVE